MTIEIAKKYLVEHNIPDWEVKEIWKPGGQGMTIKVFNSSLRLCGVLKVPKELTGKNLDRFSREIAILAEVGTADIGIAPLLSYSQPSQSPWFITKMGQPFREYWLKFRESNETDYKLIFEEALAIIKHILAGLSKLHARPDPIVHRDIKPDNIVMIDGKPNLIDFGVAFWAEKERLTDADDAVGNKRFSPDIMMYRVEDVVPWLDVFMVSQLTMWMLAEKPAKNWDRPVDFRFVRYPQALGEAISKIYAFAGVCSEESTGPKNATEMLQLMEGIFYQPQPMGKSDLAKIVSAFQNVGKLESDATTRQLNERVAAHKKIEAVKTLVSLKIKEVNDSVEAFIKNISAQGVIGQVITRNDEALQNLIDTIRERPPPSGFDASIITEMKILTPAARAIHLGVTININVIRAKTVVNPFYFNIVQLMRYEKPYYMDEQCALFDSPDYKKKLDVELIDEIKKWFEDEHNWY